MPVSTTTGYRNVTPEGLIISGIDFSINHPAICTHIGDEWSIENCNFNVLDDTWEFNHSKIETTPEIKDYVNNIDRYNQLTNFVLDSTTHSSRIYIEDYSYGSSGKVFNIAEATGILKFHINRKLKAAVEPKTLKGFATGKGNASKNQMYEKFVEETGLDLLDIANRESGKKFNGMNVPSPFSDLVDAYFVCKWGFFQKTS